MLAKVIIKKTLAEKWQEFASALSGHLLESQELIGLHCLAVKKHYVLYDVKSIRELEKVLITMNEIAPAVRKYLHAIEKKYPSFHSNKLSLEQPGLHQDIHNAVVMVLHNLMRLNEALANKYYWASRNSHKSALKNSNIKAAHQAIMEAIKFEEEKVNELRKLREGVVYISSHDEVLRLIELEYPEKCSKNEINTIVIAAKKIKDSEELYAKFGEAVVLMRKTDDYERQLDILVEQATYYKNLIDVEIMNNPGKFDCTKKYIENLSIPLIEAAQLRLTDKIGFKTNMRCERIILALYQLSVEVLFNAFSQSVNQDNMDAIDTFLGDARVYYEWGGKLAAHMSLKLSYSDALGVIISDQMELFKWKMQEIDTLRIESEKKAVQLMLCKDDYNKKFPEILQSIIDLEPVDAKKNRRKKPAELSKITNSIFQAGSSSSDESEAHEKNEIKESPCGLKSALQLLATAKSDNNWMKQATLSVDICEYHRIDALRLIKKGERPLIELVEIMEHIQIAVAYLLEAGKLISEIKRSNKIVDVQEFEVIEQWTHYILQDTQNILSNILEKIRVIERTLEESRQRAMENMHKNKKNWYKNLDIASISPKAKELIKVKEKICSAIHLQADIQTVSVFLNEPVIMPEKKSISMVADMGNSPHTLFKSEQQVMRQRSLSVDSWFDKDAIELRADKRDRYG